jgi:hypothetical protein
MLSVWWLPVVETMHSNQDLADMHFMYGLADGNAVVARRLCQERYPGRRCPDRKTFVKYPSPGLWTCKFCTSCCQQGTTMTYESWSRRGYSGYCEWNSWNQHMKGINASRCRSLDCLESVARTTAVSLPSAGCTGPVTTRLPCSSNVLPIQGS